MTITPDQARAELARRELARRGVQDTDWKGIVGSAVKSSFQKPARFAKNLGTNPETMANAMPGLLGTAGGLSPVLGGASIGTAAGQGLRDLSLKVMKKPVPGLMQHGLELGGAAMGDIMAIPAMKKSYFGGQIGAAEKEAGVVARGATKAVTPGSVGETLNNLEAQIDAGTISAPQGAKDAKEIIDQIYGNEGIYEKSPGINVQAARVSSKVQKLLNSMIPGRAAPAGAMAKAMTIPRNIGKAVRAIPRPIRKGMQYGAGAAAGGGTAYEIIKRLMGG